jgi:hypothetical protein
MCICTLFHVCRNWKVMPSLSALRVIQEVIHTQKLATTSSVFFTDSGWLSAALLPTHFLTSLCYWQHCRAGRSITHMRSTSQVSKPYHLCYLRLFCLSITDQTFQVKMHVQSKRVTRCSIRKAQALQHSSLLVVNFRPASLVQTNVTSL